MRDLQNTKQKYNESFTEYLTWWREKLGQMRHRPAKADQLIIAMEGCVPALSKKLGDLGIRNFEELYRFGVQKESEFAQEKKFFGGRPKNRNTASSSNNVKLNAIRFSLILSNNPVAIFSLILSGNQATVCTSTLLDNH